MSKMIKYGSDGRLCIAIQSTSGFPGVGLVDRKLEGLPVRHEPVSMMKTHLSKSLTRLVSATPHQIWKFKLFINHVSNNASRS